MEIKMFKTDIDFIGSKEDAKHISELWGIKITLLPNCDQAIAIVKGTKAKVKNFLIDHHYGDENEVEEIYFSN
tara:strand:+ start:347 stop:565 length:219 start_codon:yes stop_codon:yes gene_type:complete